MTTWIVLFAAAAAAGAAAGAATWWARRRAARELARVEDELARRMGELFSLQELSYVLSESLHLDRVIDQVARYLARFLEGAGTMVLLADETTGALRVAAAEGTLATLSQQRIADLGTGLLATALGHERLEVVDEATPGAELLPGVRARRAAVAPLRAHGVTVGALVVVDRAEPFSADHLRLLSTVAAHTAVVLANARFFDLLRAGKQQWETTFDALTDGIAVINDEGRIQRANKALADLLKAPIPEVIGRELGETLFGHAGSLGSLLEEARSGGPTGSWTQRSDALQRILSINAAPLPGGAPGWVVALVEDVTEQKALETQLIQHEKMAAVGQLVSGVAHELNNPLTSIAGLSELLLEQHATVPRAREHLRVIHEQAERAGKIVRNLLTFARHGPPDTAVLDLSDVVQRTVQLLEYDVRLQQIEMLVHLSRQAPLIRGDRHQIQQVVINLLTNAIQAVAQNARTEPRRIVISTTREDRYAVVEVADTGPGVPEDMVAQIFTPFFTTKDPGQGTGLGLSISYSIVERHGGQLSVGAGPHGGASFVMRLPLASLTPGTRAGAGPRRSGPAVPPPAPPSPPPGAGRKLLLVDGDHAVQRMLIVLFASDGYIVDAARDAAHALELLDRNPYDVIIADPRAAVSAGAAFGDALLQKRPDLRERTIFATADVRAETEEWLNRLGCRYFQKPVNAGQLRKAVGEVGGAPERRSAGGDRRQDGSKDRRAGKEGPGQTAGPVGPPPE